MILQNLWGKQSFKLQDTLVDFSVLKKSTKSHSKQIPLLGIDHEQIIIQKDTCTLVFIAAQLTIART